MSYSNAAAAYRSNAILTASPEKLIKMLYEGLMQNLERSRLGLEDPATRSSEEVGIALSKALGIVSELRTALDHEVGGELSERLDSLYTYSIEKISEANIQRDAKHVEQALTVLRTLKEGWDGVIPN